MNWVLTFPALLSGCKVLLRVLARIVARRDGSEQMCLLFIGLTLPIKRKKSFSSVILILNLFVEPIAAIVTGFVMFSACTTYTERKIYPVYFLVHVRYGRSGAIFGALSTSLLVLAVFYRLYFMVMEDSV